jgi:hypothetical protein
MGWQGIVFQFPVSARIYLLENIQIFSVTHPASYPLDTGGSYSGQMKCPAKE